MIGGILVELTQRYLEVYRLLLLMSRRFRREWLRIVSHVWTGLTVQKSWTLL